MPPPSAVRRWACASPSSSGTRWAAPACTAAAFPQGAPPRRGGRGPRPPATGIRAEFRARHRGRPRVQGRHHLEEPQGPQGLANCGIDCISGVGRPSQDTIEVSNDEAASVTGKNIILATGRVQDPGHRHHRPRPHPTEALQLADAESRSSWAASRAEFASVWTSPGTKVTIVEGLRLVANEDRRSRRTRARVR